MPRCRFIPTCSQYALEAVEKYGFFKALWLTCRRLLRCNPFCKGGYDPVPEKGFRNPKNAGNTENKHNTDTENNEKEN